MRQGMQLSFNKKCTSLVSQDEIYPAIYEQKNQNVFARLMIRMDLSHFTVTNNEIRGHFYIT